MRKILFVLACCLPALLQAQQPQFAVVRPNGTSYMCPTWDSAYKKAVDGDFIYLPGVTITTPIKIDKRLYIIGAGIHPDSSGATGKTVWNSGSDYIQLYSGASGGSIEGVQWETGISFIYTGKKINNYTISRCKVGTILLQGNTVPADSLPTNIHINECILLQILGYNSRSINVVKSIIQGSIQDLISCNFANNIFTYTSNVFYGVENSILQNNIFLSTQPLHPSYPNRCSNNLYNNLGIATNGGTFLNGCPSNTGIEQNTMVDGSTNYIFNSYSTSYTFPFGNNFHLKSTCIGKNAGTDGTDVGIYGTSQPTSEGWVPSNPHIYFKQIDPQTGTNGNLKIQVKVRTNN